MEETEKLDFTDSPESQSDDLVTQTAFEYFGIKYLYPWQRLVVANILEAYEYQKRLGKGEDLMDTGGSECVGADGEVGVAGMAVEAGCADADWESSAAMIPEPLDESDSDDSDSFCRGRQIVLLPTGAGKSLCFQIPAILLDGPTLVIYPLLALMTDQQRRMEEGSLRSVIFRGGQTEEEREENFQKLRNGAKIIIANPEILASESLLERLSEIGIAHIAIDEAHCVSEWGDSFRPAYLELGKIIEKINPPVITAFTATASPPVLERVSQILFGGLAHIVRSESDRQNIHYYVRQCAAKKKEVLNLAATEQRPLLVFCGTRGKTQDMAREINLVFGQGTAKFYHAGLDRSEKEDIEKWFYDSKDGILCVTCAYGMGVDKKDIKTVVHLEPPETAEAYIQEAGRGGRDGSVAKAILLWSLEDSLDYSFYEKGSRKAAMRDFAETTDCRRQVLLDALGAEQAVCSGCDLCEAREASADNHPAYTPDWQIAFNLLKKSRNFYSEEEIEERLFDLFNEKSRKKFGLNIWTHRDTVEVVNQLKDSGKIELDKFLWKGRLRVKREAVKK